MADENPPRQKPTLSVYDGKTGVETVWLPKTFPSGTYPIDTFKGKLERTLTICGDIEPEDIDVVVFNGRRFRLVPADDLGERHDAT